MPVVSNTSPILNLAIIGKLSLLCEQFDTIWIPQAVKDELRINEELPGSSEIRTAFEQGWFEVIQVKNKDKIQLLNRDLDRGESEAITLALQVKADWILLDEREARKVCKSMGLRVTGVIGIILKAWENGKIDSLNEVLDDLINNAGFRIKKSFYEKILAENRDK